MDKLLEMLGVEKLDEKSRKIIYDKIHHEK